MKWISVKYQSPPKTKDEILFCKKGISDAGEEGCYIVFAQYCKEEERYYLAYHPAYCRIKDKALLDAIALENIEDDITHWMPLELPQDLK